MRQKPTKGCRTSEDEEEERMLTFLNYHLWLNFQQIKARFRLE
jgi:hypothetical protein